MEVKRWSNLNDKNGHSSGTQVEELSQTRTRYLKEKSRKSERIQAKKKQGQKVWSKKTKSGKSSAFLKGVLEGKQTLICLI